MEDELEDRWIELCICRIESDPNCNLPDSGETTPNKLEHELLGYDEDTNGLSYHDHYNLGSSKDPETSKTDEVDLPILMLAAHLIQHSGYLLSYVLAFPTNSFLINISPYAILFAKQNRNLNLWDRSQQSQYLACNTLQGLGIYCHVQHWQMV